MVLTIISGIYSLIVGIGIICLWTFLIVTKQVPEIKIEPIAIGFHIMVENLMAILSFASGIVLLIDLAWAPILFIFSMGLIVYSVINSSGYYAQRKEWPFIVMFGVILVASTVLVVLNILQLI